MSTTVGGDRPTSAPGTSTPDGAATDSPASERTDRAAAAIRHHYDIGNDFYRLWLDSSLTYSCAMPEGPDDTLEAAQERKLRYHLDAVRADRADAVLDVGCGWGALLRRLSERHGVRHAVGLTLSEEQAAHIRDQAWPGVEVRTENWLHHEPPRRYDGIVSIGAFEHFATPEDTPEEKIHTYREFFRRCRSWLTDDGVLSLQTVAYANMAREDASSFIQQEIFPDADLPTLAEIATATEGSFEIRTLRNDRLHYAWTCEQWASRLRAHRETAVATVGAATVARYERYLKMSALGLRMGKICLLRIVLDPVSDRYFGRVR